VIFNDYSNSWKPVFPVQLEFIRSEMNSQFANIATPSEIVISTTFTLEFGGTAAEMHICFPYSMIEPIRDLLHSTIQSDQVSHDKRWTSMLRRQLQDAEVELVAQLGSNTITLRQILHLRAGDVVPLHIPETLQVVVDEIAILECRYGQQGGQYALKVEKFTPMETDTSPTDPIPSLADAENGASNGETTKGENGNG
jgi:flagellar motor switch protein FliM